MKKLLILILLLGVFTFSCEDISTEIRPATEVTAGDGNGGSGGDPEDTPPPPPPGQGGN
jgi:hypothetical protein